MTSRARSFDTAAALYAAHRPGYPEELYDAVEELAGLPFDGARVADVGAGTGLDTGPMHRRGARVTAVEPGDGMAAEFRRAHPDVPVVRGDGDRLPLATGAFDLVTYAQAWHWTDPALAVPEALRVLRPGGSLAIWWNDADETVSWVAAQAERLRAFFPAGAATHFRALPQGLPSGFATRTVAWSRRIPLEAHLANLSSHSAFLLLGAEGTRAFMEAERARLAVHFPDGTVEEPYTVSLHVAGNA
ncbi:class I SAM-dependent methyltransferase [Streptomyces sp. NPDC048507]|uniref:class I SAM-dependent methyltransferase n=1 Tax=Streptomyces sp. NPDC048507 TaxID=3365560 RepID=UPI00371C4164